MYAETKITFKTKEEADLFLSAIDKFKKNKDLKLGNLAARLQVEAKKNWKSIRNTTVISGFPGIGKTHFCKCYKNLLKVTDLDSSSFAWKEEGKTRNREFPRNYVKSIKSLLGKVDILLVSTHKEVVEALNRHNILFTIVMPTVSDKRLYMKRYRDRGSSERFLNLLNIRWEDYLEDLKKARANKIILGSDHHLSDIYEKVLRLGR